jgi:hypothetical protein
MFDKMQELKDRSEVEKEDLQYHIPEMKKELLESDRVNRLMKLRITKVEKSLTAYEAEYQNVNISQLHERIRQLQSKIELDQLQKGDALKKQEMKFKEKYRKFRAEQKELSKVVIEKDETVFSKKSTVLDVLTYDLSGKRLLKMDSMAEIFETGSVDYKLDEHEESFDFEFSESAHSNNKVKI